MGIAKKFILIVALLSASSWGAASAEKKVGLFLPDTLWQKSFTYVDLDDLARATLVCTSWRTVTNNEILWAPFVPRCAAGIFNEMPFFPQKAPKSFKTKVKRFFRMQARKITGLGSSKKQIKYQEEPCPSQKILQMWASIVPHVLNIGTWNKKALAMGLSDEGFTKYYRLLLKVANQDFLKMMEPLIIDDQDYLAAWVAYQTVYISTTWAIAQKASTSAALATNALISQELLKKWVEEASRKSAWFEAHIAIHEFAKQAAWQSTYQLAWSFLRGTELSEGRFFPKHTSLHAAQKMSTAAVLAALMDLNPDDEYFTTAASRIAILYMLAYISYDTGFKEILIEVFLVVKAHLESTGFSQRKHELFSEFAAFCSSDLAKNLHIISISDIFLPMAIGQPEG